MWVELGKAFLGAAAKRGGSTLIDRVFGNDDKPPPRITGAQAGQDAKDYFDIVAPNSSQWERIGSPAVSSGSQLAVQANEEENQKHLQRQQIREQQRQQTEQQLLEVYRIKTQENIAKAQIEAQLKQTEMNNETQKEVNENQFGKSNKEQRESYYNQRLAKAANEVGLTAKDYDLLKAMMKMGIGNLSANAVRQLFIELGVDPMQAMSKEDIAKLKGDSNWVEKGAGALMLAWAAKKVMKILPHGRAISAIRVLLQKMNKGRGGMHPEAEAIRRRMMNQGYTFN